MNKPRRVAFCAALGCAFVLLFAARVPAEVTVLHSFTGANEGLYPTSGLTISGSDLFGATVQGGTAGLGTIFRVEMSGANYQVLHRFQGGVAGGAQPQGTPTVLGANLLVTTAGGGAGDHGAIIQMGTDGTGFAVVRSFAGSPTEARVPGGSLTHANSFLHGLSQRGGAADAGSVFMTDTSGGNFQLLHSFSGGVEPLGDVTLVGSTLYGMTLFGGQFDRGTLFKVETNGTGFATLHEFSGLQGDGRFPNGKLLQVGDTLWGTTRAGGGSDLGTIFRIGLDGSGYEVAHEFAGTASDGAGPQGGLAMADNRIFGTTANGGNSDMGTVFEMNTQGFGYRLVHEFAGGAADGAFPFGDLAASEAGLFGTTKFGGSLNRGTVFTLAVPEYLLGDFNRDQEVTNADIKAMLVALTNLAAYKDAKGLDDEALTSIGDFDGSDDVTNADLQHLLNALASAGGSITVVPEPATWAISLCGFAGLVVSTIRQRGRVRKRAQCEQTQSLTNFFR